MVNKAFNKALFLGGGGTLGGVGWLAMTSGLYNQTPWPKANLLTKSLGIFRLRTKP